MAVHLIQLQPSLVVLGLWGESTVGSSSSVCEYELSTGKIISPYFAS